MFEFINIFYVPAFITLVLVMVYNAMNIEQLGNNKNYLHCAFSISVFCTTCIFSHSWFYHITDICSPEHFYTTYAELKDTTQVIEGDIHTFQVMTKENYIRLCHKHRQANLKPEGRYSTNQDIVSQNDELVVIANYNRNRLYRRAYLVTKTDVGFATQYLGVY